MVNFSPNEAMACIKWIKFISSMVVIMSMSDCWTMEVMWRTELEALVARSERCSSACAWSAYRNELSCVL